MCDFSDIVHDAVSFVWDVAASSVASLRTILSFIVFLVMSGLLIYFGIAEEVALLIGLVTCWPVAWTLALLAFRFVNLFNKGGRERSRKIKAKVAADMAETEKSFSTTLSPFS